jgi:hypothetical protein
MLGASNDDLESGLIANAYQSDTADHMADRAGQRASVTK